MSIEISREKWNHIVHLVQKLERLNYDSDDYDHVWSGARLNKNKKKTHKIIASIHDHNMSGDWVGTLNEILSFCTLKKYHRVDRGWGLDWIKLIFNCGSITLQTGGVIEGFVDCDEYIGINPVKLDFEYYKGKYMHRFDDKPRCIKGKIGDTYFVSSGYLTNSIDFDIFLDFTVLNV